MIALILGLLVLMSEAAGVYVFDLQDGQYEDERGNTFEISSEVVVDSLGHGSVPGAVGWIPNQPAGPNRIAPRGTLVQGVDLPIIREPSHLVFYSWFGSNSERWLGGGELRTGITVPFPTEWDTIPPHPFIPHTMLGAYVEVHIVSEIDFYDRFLLKKYVWQPAD